MTLSISKLVSLTLVTLVIGVAIGQKIMSYAHDLNVLEHNTLNFVQIAYIAGCSGMDRDKKAPKSNRRYDQCVDDSVKYRIDVTEIFHDKIWDHSPSK